MIVRIRSKDGIFRFKLEPSDDVALLIEKVLETAPQADPATLTFSNQPRGGEGNAAELKGNSLGELGIAHGHLLYAAYKEKEATPAEAAGPSDVPGATAAANAEPTAAASSSKQPIATSRPWENVKEDPVDLYWAKKDGMIPRPKDSKFCRHGDKAMCDYCMPLEPYDAKYQAEQSIKHISFHAHLKKLDVATNASKPAQTYIPPLEEPNYSVRVPCPSGQHPSWPSGICTKCQPSAITLQSQEYRMADHVEFSHPQLIENLLSFWRSTGSQRYGFLLGHYEPYEVVPMGIKAVVEAIHEPPQEGETDGLTLGVPWEDQARVEKLASLCNLQIVGQIYTDLSPADPTFTDPAKAGQVLCKRHKDSFFLSSLEATFAGQLQASNPNPCKYSMTGQYGSKFVTCVLSGTEEGAIDVSAYQISEQGVGMVKSDMIEASVSPGIVRVKKSEGERYVPEVFYRYKNNYGIEVKESAKPTFPVEYLLVTLTHGFPNIPSPRFLGTTPFAVENRPGLHDQTFNKAIGPLVENVERLLPHVGTVDVKGKRKESEDLSLVRQQLVGSISDWHLLAFLDQSTDVFGPGDIEALCKVAVSHDTGTALDELLARPCFQKLAETYRKNGGQQAASGGGGEVLGDYAGDDYMPPEAMGDGNSGVPSNPPQARASATSKRAEARQGSTVKNDVDDFTYTGEDDDDMNYEDVEEDGYDDDEADVGNDEMFDDASSSISADAAPSPPAPAAPAAPTAPTMIACPHCTFENAPGSVDCDVCGLPLSG